MFQGVLGPLFPHSHTHLHHTSSAFPATMAPPPEQEKPEIAASRKSSPQGLGTETQPSVPVASGAAAKRPPLPGRAA